MIGSNENINIGKPAAQPQNELIVVPKLELGEAPQPQASHVSSQKNLNPIHNVNSPARSTYTDTAAN